MSKKKKGYVVPHTHWDREWRYPLWENRMYLKDMMDELVETLEANEGYHSFLLDGQTRAITDYLEVCPEKKERLEALIAQGRIQIGPWYTLPDLYPISGESMIRNLLKGKEEAEKLNGYLKIGYESFGWGQPSQLPQIYKGFDIDTVIVSKNVDKTRAPKSEFHWIGADETKVLATRLGNDARANFFMNAYLKIMTGKEYKSEEYEYQYGEDGQVYHQADSSNYIQDYFRMENTEYIHPEYVKEAVTKAWEGTNDSWLSDDRVMMDGTDSTTAQPQLMSLLKELNQACEDIDFVSSSMEEYVTVLKEKLPMEKLLCVHGEMRDGPTTSLSGNALMTRPYIKTLNKKVENKLFGMAEPISALTMLLGEQYEQGFLKTAMEYLLLSHPHDSINGVTQDKTCEDVMYRLAQAEEIADAVYNRGLQKILQKIDYSQYQKDDIVFVVFNPTAKPRTEILKLCLDTPQAQNIWDFEIEDAKRESRQLQRVERTEKVSPVVHLHSRPFPYYTDRHTVYFDTGEVPAGGYQMYKLINMSHFDRKTAFWAKTRKTDGDEIGIGCDRLENEFLDIRINSDGSIHITDKRTREVYGPLNYFESTGDVGDYWMYYPPYNNKTYISKGTATSIYMKENGNLSATVGVEMVMELPAYANRPRNYVGGDSSRCSEKNQVAFTIFYTLNKDSRQVDVALEVENHCRDHRMSVVLDACVDTEVVEAQGHFTVDTRSMYPLRDANNQYYNELTTQPMQSFVSVYDGKKRGLGILTDCLGEYEYRKDGALALTLFRAVKNIICTEFRSEGYFPNQDGGQLQRKLCYHYAITPQSGNYVDENLSLRAEALKVQLKPIQTTVPNQGDGRLPTCCSLYQVAGNVEVSCMKRAEDGKSIILRLFNTGSKVEQADIHFYRTLKAAYIVDLKEDCLEKANIVEQGVTLDIDVNKIVTLKLEFALLSAQDSKTWQ